MFRAGVCGFAANFTKETKPPQKETPKKNQRSTKTCGTKPDM
jgi:hypothetical protein